MRTDPVTPTRALDEKPFVSVVVPVYNEHRLSLCLDALERQTYAHESYEVIVVDNGSKPPIELDRTRHPHATLAVESRPGSYAARNMGLSLARGQIIAFTDADCVPTENWLQRGAERLAQGTPCEIVAGRVELYFANESKPTAAELYDSLRMGFPQRLYADERHFGVTANLVTWRTGLDQVGLFDPTLTSSGDLEWGQRAHAAGLRLCYAEDVVVRHPARRTFKELHEKVTRRAGGRHALGRARGSGTYLLAKAVAKDIVPPLRFAILLSRRSEIPGRIRLRLIFYRYALRCANAWERLRLQFRGGQAHR